MFSVKVRAFCITMMQLSYFGVNRFRFSTFCSRRVLFSVNVTRPRGYHKFAKLPILRYCPAPALFTKSVWVWRACADNTNPWNCPYCETGLPLRFSQNQFKCDARAWIIQIRETAPTARLTYSCAFHKISLDATRARVIRIRETAPTAKLTYICAFRKTSLDATRARG